jgi:hypothetical protein
MLKDSENKALTSQQITSMSFASTKPPRFDCEIFTDSNKAALIQKDEDALSSKRSANFTGDDGSLGYQDNYIVFVILLRKIMSFIGSFKRHSDFYSDRQLRANICTFFSAPLASRLNL